MATGKKAFIRARQLVFLTELFSGSSELPLPHLFSLQSKGEIQKKLIFTAARQEKLAIHKDATKWYTKITFMLDHYSLCVYV